MNNTTARRAAGSDKGAHEPSERPAIPPFWHKLNSFFLFPFQLEPLLYALLLALGSYLLFLPLLVKVFVVLGLVLAASRYAFKVAALASRGVLHSRDFTAAVEDPDWKVLPWKFFGVLLVHGFVIAFLGARSPTLALVASLVSSLILPATLMVLIQSFSLRAALNPFELLATMAGIGWQYLLLCLFLFLLQSGFPQALRVLVPITPRWLLLPMFVFAAVYFLWVMASLIGYVMYQHHGALEIDLLREPEAQAVPGARPVDPAKAEARERDAEVAALVQDGRLQDAITQAREWARTGHDRADDQRRDHRVLLLDDPASGRLADHTQRYLKLLLAQKHGAEALDTLQAVQAKLPEFAADNGEAALALAEQAWKLGDAQRTVALLRGFDRRHPGTPQVPGAYELSIRVLKQGLGRGAQALPIYQALARRYPDHPATQEAAWVLREELASAA